MKSHSGVQLSKGPFQGLNQLQQQIEQVIRGKSEAVRMALVTLLAGGHLLLEDVPGVGKTTLAQAVARGLACTFQRIQFTSDLLPADIIGLSIFNQRTSEFEFRRGPIFANIILADEINRTTPKTQSSLLEAMAEGHVTVENHTHELPRPFLVLATQNPVEHHGAYPLPESQMDRFMMRVRMGYPSADAEKQILRNQATRKPVEDITPTMSGAEIIALQEQARQVRMDDALLDYLLTIVAATRDVESLDLGVSPRGSLALFRAAQALAYSEERDYCIVDDIKRLVIPVLGHRLVISSRYSSRLRRGDEADTILTDIMRNIPVPI
ncbi:MAG: AAA family ATPase [Blastocatellia bacterium]